MSNISDRIAKLLIKAGHPNTPEKEAATTAMVAAKLFYKHKDELLGDRQIEAPKSSYIPPDDIPDISTVETEGVEVQLFNVVLSKNTGICISCSKPYNTGEIVARAQGKGTAHYKCRHYWTKTG